MTMQQVPEPLLPSFEGAHLPKPLQEVSSQFEDVAQWMVMNLPRNPERTAGLRKLLEARDCALRARPFK